MLQLVDLRQAVATRGLRAIEVEQSDGELIHE
jgi:hypothetical protein